MKIKCATCGREAEAAWTEGGHRTAVCDECIDRALGLHHPEDYQRLCATCGARFFEYGLECRGCRRSE